MTKRKTPDLADFARLAAVESANAIAVGEFQRVVDEGDSVWSFLFASKLSGYHDWHWSVTVYAPAKQEPTVSEVVLLPGLESLIAPNWVPWSERLADWKALQVELEAQAAAEAAEATDLDEESPDVGEEADEEADDFEELDDDFDAVDSEQSPEKSLEEPEASALSDGEEGVDSENDSNNTGERPPRSGRRNRRWGNNKNRQGDRPKGDSANNDKS
jgi:hypothetical protein